MTGLKVATHNVWVKMADPKAATAIRLVLHHEPDLLGIQEWGRGRASVLRQFGTVVRAPRLRKLWRAHPTEGYLFVYPVGGQPVAVNAARLEVNGVHRWKLSDARPGVRATFGTEVSCEDRLTGETVALLNVHPVAHHDRPNNRAAHAQAVENIRAWADHWDGYRRYVVGDMNSRNVKIPGLVSCWQGRPDGGSFRGRPIDHIYGPDAFEAVEVVNTPSDHHAVIVTEKE